jgi:hypothetical protein
MYLAQISNILKAQSFFGSEQQGESRGKTERPNCFCHFKCGKRDAIEVVPVFGI